MKEFTEQNFKKSIAKGTVVVDFWAPWCGPCKMMGPEFAKAAQKVTGVEFAKVNVEEHGALAQEYGIMSIPTTILFKNGEQIDRHSGAMNAASIEKFVKQ